jgi:phage tail-like protein
MERIRSKEIDAPESWMRQQMAVENLEYRDGLRLARQVTYIFDREIPVDARYTINDGAADECGNLWLSCTHPDPDHGPSATKGGLLLYDRAGDRVNLIGCGEGMLPVALRCPTRIAVDPHTIYVLDTDPASARQQVIALARVNLQVRWILSRTPEGGDLEGIADISPACGSLLVLARSEKRLFRIDRAGRIAGSLGAGEGDPFSDPTAIATGVTPAIYVLDGNSVHVLSVGSAGGISWEGKYPVGNLPSPAVLSGLALDPGGHLFAGDADATSPFVYLLERPEADPGFSAIPLTSLREVTTGLVHDGSRSLYAITTDGKRFVRLAAETVNRPDGSGRFRGTWTSLPLDSGTPGTRWHRLVLDGEFGENTSTGLSCYLSDTPVADGVVLALPEDEWIPCLPGRASLQGPDRRDALFPDACLGRYLWSRIALEGTEAASPVVASIAVQYPRISYLDYLPAIYREDTGSAAFLDPFLAIFEGTFTGVDIAIDRMSRLFDPLATPPEFLPWLATWLAVSRDEEWPEEKLRGFIRNAALFYRKRGTREGLEEMLRFFLEGTGYRWYVVENFHVERGTSACLARVPDASACRDLIYFPTAGTGIGPDPCRGRQGSGDGESGTAGTGAGEEPELLSHRLFGEGFCFCVLLGGDPGGEGPPLPLVKRIAEEHRPAHGCSGLLLLEPWFHLDMHTYLGVNTWLTRPSFVLGEGPALARGTVIMDREESGQVEKHTRIGIDARIT